MPESGIFGYKYGYYSGVDAVMVNIEQIIITSEMLSLIAEIDEFKGAWQSLGRLAPDRLSALKKVATIESIGSSTRIEGAKLSDREVEALLGQLHSTSFQSRDEQEVAGYAAVCEKIFAHYNAMPITENAIKQMHVWLLQYSHRDERHRGEYKKIPVRIDAFDGDGKNIGTVFETTSPLETPIKMHELIAWTSEALNGKLLHPLMVIGLFTVLFLAIHPFQDGNGRISRLMTTFLMMKCGYQYVLYSSLESFIEANKESYYLALQKTQKSWQKGQPDWTPWLLFFLQCLQRQKHHLELKISQEMLIVKSLSTLVKQVLELLEAHGSLGIRELQILTKANHNTLKKTLADLVENNRIRMSGRGKSTKYSL